MLDDGSPTGGERLPVEAQRPAETVEERREDRAHLRELGRARQLRVAKAVAILVIVVLLFVFVISNAKPVPVDFVFVTRHPELIWVMIGCIVSGAVVGYLLGRPGRNARLHGRRDEPGG